MNIAVRIPPRKKTRLTPVVTKVQPSHSGAHGKAKILTPDQLQTALGKCDESTFPTRDRLMLLLSHYAALRAQEIAYLEYEDICDVEGRIVGTLHVSKKAGKYGKERDIPMHPVLLKALKAYCAEAEITDGPIFFSRFGEQMTPNAVQKQIKAIYKACNFKGASSHSGRRGFITRLARSAGQEECSLVDVQKLAGHASLTTTALYIDASPQAKRLVMAL
ncbi:site-specific integrase [Pseudaminobacter sp. 19-2017]|uniref:Site-specific integrase n=1 Tax=Pseudaminobacter soli (ex Zhang et al. 2022) TaxID=2831468 RepID=A0A942E0R2_9HYPH|nr:site-specific integrase [Pseudaminobacter soli]MBS3648745.1 site-specific integrase [Pseudaminobacter soli]